MSQNDRRTFSGRIGSRSGSRLATFCALRFVLLCLLLSRPSLADVRNNLVPTETPERRFAIRYPRPVYQNYAFNHWENYPDHSWKTRQMGSQHGVAFGVDRPAAKIDLMGNHLTTGYDLFTWVERRQAGQRFGSHLFKDWSAWQPVFTNVVVGSDGYGNWGYRAMVGDGLIARLSPLTLSRTDFNGLRVDLSTPHLKLTTLGSRIARPNRESTTINENVAEVDTDHSTLLLGGRAQLDLGQLSIGFNGANLHSYNSTEANNSIKGRLRQDQPTYSFIVVRFSDDAPEDGRPGASVQSVQLLINDEVRPDVPTHIIRKRLGARPQAGRTLTLTGQFIPSSYTQIDGPVIYYRNSELPLFADFLYRVDHEAGVDVAKLVRLEGLLEEFQFESPGRILNADGSDQLVYLFDLREEPFVESVEVEAVVGNDYLVEWAGVNLNASNAGAERYEDRYRSTFLRTAMRARGRVSDLSNLARRRFAVAENTGIYTYSADLQLTLSWLDISAEYARSALYSRYPARLLNQTAVNEGPRSVIHGSALFLNGIRRFKGGILGFEAFSMSPDFTTQMPTYVKKDYGYIASRGYSPYHFMTNDTIIWSLVQDNEDGDRWRDIAAGNVLGSPQKGGGGRTAPVNPDQDGIFPGQDEDNDGLIDSDRNFNGAPDYDEPFLLFDVDPNEYVYGLDRNNNDEPDVREDDWQPDYPYDPNQRGYHLFGQLNLSSRWSVGLGRYAVRDQIGGGRNRSNYALLTYRRTGLGQVRKLFFENSTRQVQDDIADPYNQYSRGARLSKVDPYDANFIGLIQRFSSTLFRREDILLYQRSKVNESYLEGHLRPLEKLKLVQKLRLRFNWQQGGPLPIRQFQRDRRLDFFAYVNRVEYAWTFGKFDIVPRFKFLYLRLHDNEANIDLQSEHRIIPILKTRFAIMPKTTLQLGIQGWGPVPYRINSRTQSRESLKQRSTLFTVTNRTRYLGYELINIVGFSRDKLKYDDPSQKYRQANGFLFFVRSTIGFTEFGTML